MCRFIAYLGQPLVIDEILFKPSNSLIKQSIHAREMEEPLNGDGFGLGWYAPEIDNTPALFRSIQPAWNDQNLKYLAPKIQSPCFFAHVRAATYGEVSQNNCHPFHYKRLLFMHNGDIGGFDKIKRYLCRKLSDEFYEFIRGETDSEHLFALFLDNFYKKQLEFTAQHAAQSLIETIQEVEKLQKKHNAVQRSYINAVITNGKNMVVIRYDSQPEGPLLSLHYTFGSKYQCFNGNCHITNDSAMKNNLVLVASERLTDFQAEWHQIPINHMLLVHDNLLTTFMKI